MLDAERLLKASFVPGIERLANHGTVFLNFNDLLSQTPRLEEFDQ